jgi:hypothetical protein
LTKVTTGESYEKLAADVPVICETVTWRACPDLTPVGAPQSSAVNVDQDVVEQIVLPSRTVADDSCSARLMPRIVRVADETVGVFEANIDTAGESKVN